MRTTIGGLVLGAVLTIAWHPPVKAQDPPAPLTPQDVIFKDDGTCHGPATDTDTVTPGSGKLKFTAPEKCAFRTMPADKMPKVTFGNTSLPVTVAADRQTFEVDYTLPTDKNACLRYTFTLTPAGETSPMGPGAGWLCNGIQ